MGHQQRIPVRPPWGPFLKLQVLAAFATALAASAALAGPADYIFMPAVECGEREINLKHGAASKQAEPSQQAASLRFGYGATKWWLTEFYVKGEREGASNRLAALERENEFQLTETGRYPVAVDFIMEFALPHDHSEP